MVSPWMAWGASCCGGGGDSTLILPKEAATMISLSAGWERYDGFWDNTGKYLADPEDSNLNQTRLTTGLAYRLAPRWQGSLSIPYVMNDNRYAGETSRSQGLGDTSLGLWYENFDNTMCVYKVDSLADLMPAVYLGAALTLPTGKSPYGKSKSSFDVTGRGFYRLDANLLVEKTIYPITVSIQTTYGTHMQRPVNQEYGRYVEPYQKKLGDRFQVTYLAGYTYFMDNLDTLTLNLTWTDLREKEASINGNKEPASDMAKKSAGGSLAWATMNKDWVVTGGFSQALKAAGGGRNFPVTETISLGVRYVDF
ncbi:MAG: hypothetical protein OEW12_09895 [Deltaproteobacteria bacterium]|nr:hypothetical protein [Deltaproteobacteria bacterium]